MEETKICNNFYTFGRIKKEVVGVRLTFAHLGWIRLRAWLGEWMS